MIQTIDKNSFIHAFEQYGRAKNWSIEGLEALFDYLEETEDPENPTELDVIGIDCEFSETSLTELKADYSHLLEDEEFEDDEEVAEWFSDQTTFIPLKHGRCVYQQF